MEGINFFPEQQKAIEFMLGSPYSILALPPGMGKTLCASAVAMKIKNRRCLVVCPSYLTYNWRMEIKKFFPSAIVDIIKTGKDIYYPVDSDFVVISYDLATKAEMLFEWANVLLIDEAHFIKSFTAKRTETLHRYIYENSIPRVHLLTGTPVENRVAEYYSLMSACHYNPKLEFSYFLEKFPDPIKFADYFSYRSDIYITRNFREIVIPKWEGLKNEAELKEWLKPIYFRLPATYPPVTRRYIQVADEDNIQLELAFKEVIEDTDSFSVMPQVKSAAAVAKAKHTIAYCDNLLDTEADHLLIYTDHREPAEIIARHFKVKPITGEMPTKVRAQMGEDFQDGKIKVIVATVGSFSTGVTLTRANHLVFNDFPWVPGRIDQTEHRINRKGQSRHCVFHYLLGSRQDKYILDTLESKREVIDRST